MLTSTNTIIGRIRDIFTMKMESSLSFNYTKIILTWTFSFLQPAWPLVLTCVRLHAHLPAATPHPASLPLPKPLILLRLLRMAMVSLTSCTVPRCMVSSLSVLRHLVCSSPQVSSVPSSVYHNPLHSHLVLRSVPKHVVQLSSRALRRRFTDQVSFLSFWLWYRIKRKKVKCLIPKLKDLDSWRCVTSGGEYWCFVTNYLSLKLTERKQ